jgi:pimeloyl-ACP methyl ester carboxylesterase
VPGIGLQDTMLLSDLFVELNDGRSPMRTFLIGGSMGGHTTILGLHQYPRAFAGGLALCPAGPELFDFFLGAGAAAEFVTGLQFEPDTAAQTLARMTAMLGQPGSYTELGLRLASIQIQISGGPRPFALEGLESRFAANISGSALAGSTAYTSLAATNVHIDYDIDPGLGLTADEINAGVRRKPAYPYFRGEMSPYPELKPFDGRIERPLLTNHTTGDLFVPIFLQQVLKRAVDRAGTSDLLVQRIIRSPGHCTFSPEETIREFDDLVAWVREGRRPAGDEDEILGDLSDAGRRFTTPIRPGDPGGVQVQPASVATP